MKETKTKTTERIETEMKEAKNKPTAEEKRLANELQATPELPPQAPAPIQRVNTFAQLAKVSRDSRIVFGSASAQWVKTEMLFNDQYREGLESIPFFITRAWKFKSKQGYGERLGIEIAMSNGRIYSVAFPWNDADEKRKDILAMFSERNASPLGPVCIRKLPKDKGNDYYDIAAYESNTNISTDIDMPFVEINDDVPF